MIFKKITKTNILLHNYFYIIIREKIFIYFWRKRALLANVGCQVFGIRPIFSPLAPARVAQSYCQRKSVLTVKLPHEDGTIASNFDQSFANFQQKSNLKHIWPINRLFYLLSNCRVWCFQCEKTILWGIVIIQNLILSPEIFLYPQRKKNVFGDNIYFSGDELNFPEIKILFRVWNLLIWGDNFFRGNLKFSWD